MNVVCIIVFFLCKWFGEFWIIFIVFGVGYWIGMDVDVQMLFRDECLF